MQVPVNFEGFTPIFDQVVNDIGEDGKPLGLITAAVFGVIWRYCQMEKGLCEASLEKIAARVGLSSRTAIRHIEILCKMGYVRDATPNVRNAPHQYYDMGKVRMRGKVRNEGETESHGGYDRESHQDMTESQLKKQYKKQKETIIKEPSAQLFSELVSLLKMPLNMMTPPMQRAYDNFIMDIQELGAKPGDIDRFGHWWYETDWRGKDGQKPTLSQVREKWGEFLNPHQNGSNGKTIQNEDGSYYL